MKHFQIQSFAGILVAAGLSLFNFNAFAQEAPVFTDVSSDHPHFQAISYLHQHHIVEGYPDHSFQPEKKVNRAEALKIILLGSEIFVPDIHKQEIFPDVLADSWYAKYVLKGKNLNIVRGDDQSGFFRPGDTVNLAEALKMLLFTNQIYPDLVRNNPYPDVARDSWFAPYFAYAKSHELLDGSDKVSIHPDQPVDRGVLAELIYRLKVKPKATINTYASYYGKGFHGRGTASGEVFDENKFTAAHRTYSFNTYLRVTNTDNGKSVIVKVNDRGPYSSKNRVIDLSKAAFQAIAPLSNGVIPVTLEEIPATETPPTPDNPDARILKADIFENSKSCSFSDSSLSYLGQNDFESILLDQPLPQRFPENEIVHIQGKVSNSAKKVSLFLVDESKTQTLFQSPVENGDFHLMVHFPHAGSFQIGIITGEEGTSPVRELEVAPASCLAEQVKDSLNPISAATVLVGEGNTKISWNPTAYTLFKLTLRQGPLLKSYLIHNHHEWVPPYADFKDFKEGDVEMILRGANFSEKAVLSASKISWSQPYVQSFKVTRHFDYKVDTSKIELLTVSPFTAVRSALQLSFKPKTDLREMAAVITPEGPTREFLLSSPSVKSKLNQKSISFFSAGSYVLSGEYNVEDIGTHVLEINDVEGLAAINIPVYAKNQFPLLPNLSDLHTRAVTDLGNDTDALRKKMLELVNADRATAQLAPVILDSSLTELAQTRADDMGNRNYFGHWNPEGIGAEELKAKFGITTTVSENLAKEVDLEFAEYGFMTSAIHRANILGQDWTRLGVGLKKTTDGSYLFVQIYAPDPVDVNSINPLRTRLLEALNKKRVMAPFVFSDALNEISQDWSNRMAQEDFFGWTDPQGTALASRVRQVEPTKTFGTYIVANSTFSSAVEQLVQNAQLKEKQWHVLGIGIAQDRVGIIKITLIYTE